MEIVIITDEQFLRFKGDQTDLDERYQAKIDQMLKCVCFSDNGSMFTKFVHNGTVTRNFHHTRNNHRPHASHRASRQRSLNYLDKLTRELYAILNKITNSTQAMLSEKIIRLVDANSVELITRTVLEKSITQSCYIPIFLVLLTKIQAKFPTVLNLIADEFTNKYIETFQESIQFLAVGAPRVEEYNEFCHYCKRKAAIFDNNRLILGLIKNNMTQFTLASYYDQLLQESKLIMWNEHSSDTLLKIMLLLAKSTKLSVQEFVLYLEQSGIADTFDSKSRFIFYDLKDQCRNS